MCRRTALVADVLSRRLSQQIENEIADAQRCQKDLENGWQRPAPCLFRVDNQRERARRQGAIDPLIDLPVEMVWGLSLTMLLLERSYWMVSYFFLIHQTKEMH